MKYLDNLTNRLLKQPLSLIQFKKFLKKSNRFYDDIDLEIELLISNGYPLQFIDDNVYLTTTNTRIKDQTFCIVDIETTASNPYDGQLLEIAAIKVKNGKILETYSSFVSASHIPQKIQEITSITPSMLYNAPNIQTVLEEFKIFLEDDIFVAHNIDFDYKFISDSFDKFYLGELANRKLCTIELSKNIFNLRRYGLKYITKILDIGIENHHRAIDDTKATCELFFKCIENLPQDIITTEDLIRFSKIQQKDRKNMFKQFILKDFENSAKQLESILENNRRTLDKLLEIEDKTYENFVVPYQKMAQDLEEFITPIFHIDSVKNSELTQKVYNECLPLISIYSSQLSSNEKIYRAFLDIQYKYKSTLSTEQQKVLENEIRDFKLGGCGLSDEDKQKLEDINLKLSELSKEFSQNLLNATNAYEMIIENEEDIKEIPKSDLELAKFEEDGKIKYKFTLQMPSYIAYITYGSNREKREEIYKAYSTRAPQNGKLIEQVLKLREEEANLLGFENYAQLSLATKMASSEDTVIDFLYELAKYAKPKAIEELDELREFARSLGCDDIQSYDLAYYSQKLKESKYDIDEEYYRPYFEKNSVVSGLFDFLYKLFDIEFVKIKEDAWDEKVDVYHIFESGKLLAKIYLDLEAREDKRGGAWMNNWQTHYELNSDKNLASAYVVCNFPQSNSSTPSLLRHSDVVTLFHEMGHAIHHLLSDIKEPFVSGINGVAWDTVEFPSQFLEYFAYTREVLVMFAKHYETQEILDDEAIEKLIVARNFQSSLATLRQVEFALFDFKLHQKLYNENGVQELLDNIRADISVIQPPKYNKFQNGFSHIFSGGYAAGYYSYKWAEVLSATGYMLFIDNGVLDEQLALRYKNFILKKGGSFDMNELFYQFSGKMPEVKSLLKIDGII